MMTKKQAEYLNRLHDRRRMLERRLEQTPEAATFRVDIKKELNALKWAIEIVEKALEKTDETD